ncbi:lipase maturation factor 1 [Strongylocentrotus purpuratus]|uniref:Lipase maturation factor n=1 Tax=Strongylocentrotus purpuratus TaxID=7668 RepID=A0A7M7LLF5_STRPU|nr:lipase maturation factor 1 [Strongylocentrotus purpuratus]
MEGIRHRKRSGNDENKTGSGDTGNSDVGERKESVKIKKTSRPDDDDAAGSNSYWLTRIVFLRSLSFVYFVAFLVALHQNRALLGQKGLLPTSLYLDRIRTYVKAPSGQVTQEAINFSPTLLWFVDLDQDLDWWLDALAYSGLALSGTVLVLGCSNMVIMIGLWVLYHSLVNIGQKWYSFGWESQLLETGFLAVFMCPLLTLSRFPRHTPTPWVTLWGYKWLLFRIMIGAGLIKIRGDQCWRDLTCMNYHYETQPVPNPMSYYMHQSPEWFHKFETLSNHFIELVTPVFLLTPWRPLRLTGGILQVLFQVTLIISGNLSFLNWLTILPAISCFDDRSLAWLFPSWLGNTREIVAKIHSEEEQGIGPKANAGDYIRKVAHISLALLLAYLSIPVVKNLLSSRQAMNTSFDSFRIVNTYGAFGSITKERTEVIFQGTGDPNPSNPAAEWLEYEFKCKPGDIRRRPCLITPYHYRLDWLLWFAAFQNYQANPWFIHLAGKLLINDNQTLDLIAYNPFQDQEPPKYIRVEHYRYKYTKMGSKDALDGKWWKRKQTGAYMPPVSMESLENYFVQQSWDLPKHIKRKIREERRAKARMRKEFT